MQPKFLPDSRIKPYLKLQLLPTSDQKYHITENIGYVLAIFSKYGCIAPKRHLLEIKWEYIINVHNTLQPTGNCVF